MLQQVVEEQLAAFAGTQALRVVGERRRLRLRDPGAA
ncbi:hypothetical protein M770_27495 [Pseudomonas aeruginosa VRFPA03]|nr:hypothetical protein M770_27495 [Pseudomonas aeruginosa VRFPA03]